MKRKKRPSLEDLIPNSEYRNEIEKGLLEGKPLIGPDGVFTDLLQSFVDAALDGELTHHLKSEKESGQKNRRNGHGTKRVKSMAGELSITTPRDRDGTFEPQIVGKRQKEFKDGFEETVITLYGQGNSIEDIHRLLKQMYGISYSTSAISLITERVWPEILSWQQRPLQAAYAIIYLDGMHFRVKTDGHFQDKTVYTVYGVDIEGNRDILGIYMDKTESAGHWRLVLEDIQKRGVEEVFFFCIDGLKGFKEVIHEVFPKAFVQRCIVHKIRNSIKYATDTERKKMCADLREVYTAANRDQAQLALETFEQKWGKKGERIAELWRKDWDELMVFMDYSQHIRRMIYTTNPVEAVHRIIRKITKSKGAWINEKALTKQLYLTLKFNEKSWRKKAYNWKNIQSDLEHKFGERFSKWLQH